MIRNRRFLKQDANENTGKVFKFSITNLSIDQMLRYNSIIFFSFALFFRISSKKKSKIGKSRIGTIASVIIYNVNKGLKIKGYSRTQIYEGII